MAVIAALLVTEPLLSRVPFVGMALAAVAAMDCALRGRARRGPLAEALTLAFLFVALASTILVLPLTGAQSAVAIAGAAAWPYAIAYGTWRLGSGGAG
jgi:hypothetical protein